MVFHSSPSSFPCSFQQLQFLKAPGEKMWNCQESISPSLTGSRAAHIQIYLEIFTCANPHFFQHFPWKIEKPTNRVIYHLSKLLNLLWCGQAGIYPAAALVWSAQSRDERASAPSECPCGLIPLQVLGISCFHWHYMALSFPCYPCMESRALSLDLQPKCWGQEGRCVWPPDMDPSSWALLGGRNYISHSYTWEIFHPSLVNLYIQVPTLNIQRTPAKSQHEMGDAALPMLHCLV